MTPKTITSNATVIIPVEQCPTVHGTESVLSPLAVEESRAKAGGEVQVLAYPVSSPFVSWTGSVPETGGWGRTATEPWAESIRITEVK